MAILLLLAAVGLTQLQPAGEPAFFTYLRARPAPTLVAYTPFEFDPRAPHALPSDESIAADLAALRHGFDGLVLYDFRAGLTPRIVQEAIRQKYRCVVLGVYSLSEQELIGTADLVRRHHGQMALAVILGNEGLAFGRYSEEQLTRAKARLEALLSGVHVPITTSEPFSQYGQKFVQDFGSFLAPNIHPVFDAPNLDPRAAALWVRQRATDLATTLNKPAFVKETGHPNGPEPRFGASAQRKFWESYVAPGLLHEVRDAPGIFVSFAAAFESGNLRWKAQESGNALEGHWGLLTPQRQPLEAFEIWRTIREQSQTFPMHSTGPDLATAVDRARGFLNSQMDKLRTGTRVYSGRASQAVSFYPSGWQGAIAEIKTSESLIPTAPDGTESLTISFKPKDSAQWFAVAFLYPNIQAENWGKVAGQNLSGAHELSGWIRGKVGGELIDLAIGGITKQSTSNSLDGFDDRFDLKQRIKLSTAWMPVKMALPHDVDLRSVIGGLTVSASAAENAQGVEVELASFVYNHQTDSLGLIPSYTHSANVDDDLLRNAAFVYDTSLAILQYLAARTDDGNRRAKSLADALVWAQCHDRAAPGKCGPWRNAYASWPLNDVHSNSARLPGIYKADNREVMAEDRYAASTDCGNQAYCILALLAAHRRFEAGRTGNHPYLRAAIVAGKWVEANCRASDQFGGYTGGFEGWEKTATNPMGPQKLAWRSTEHAIDLYAAFFQIGLAVKQAATMDPDRWYEREHTAQHWFERAQHAKKFVLDMWDEKGYFVTGLRDNQGTKNRDAIPLDVQVWSIMSLGDDLDFQKKIGWLGKRGIPAPLLWCEANCRESMPGGIDGFRFSDKGKTAWPEGMSQVAACWSIVGEPARSKAVLENVAKTQWLCGGIPAAVELDAETGFIKDFGLDGAGKPVIKKWTYPPRPHVSASSWFCIASSTSPNVYWFDCSPLP